MSEHLIGIESEQQFEDLRKNVRRLSDVSTRLAAERYNLLRDAVEGNPWQRLGKLEGAIYRLHDIMGESVFGDTHAALNDIEEQLELFKICLQKFAPVLNQAMVQHFVNADPKVSKELIGESPERMRREKL